MSKINSVFDVSVLLHCSEATVKNKCKIIYNSDNNKKYVDKLYKVWVIFDSGIPIIKGMIKPVGHPCKERAIPLNKRKINKKVL